MSEECCSVNENNDTQETDGTCPYCSGKHKERDEKEYKD